MPVADLVLANIEFSIYCVVSLILGGLIGLERESRRKTAGFKTHVMISLGATIFTYVSFNVGEAVDPARIAAQVVSGIGFIGAGSILQSKQFVVGLTTAATLWVTAAIGMLVGAGIVIPSLIATAVVLLFLLITNYWDYSYRTEKTPYCLKIEFESSDHLADFETLIERSRLTIYSKDVTIKKRLNLTMNYATTSARQLVFVRGLQKLPGVEKMVLI